VTKIANKTFGLFVSSSPITIRIPSSNWIYAMISDGWKVDRPAALR